MKIPKKDSKLPGLSFGHERLVEIKYLALNNDFGCACVEPVIFKKLFECCSPYMFSLCGGRRIPFGVFPTAAKGS